jgi:hypothetical protein
MRIEGSRNAVSTDSQSLRVLLPPEPRPLQLLTHHNTNGHESTLAPVLPTSYPLSSAIISSSASQQQNTNQDALRFALDLTTFLNKVVSPTYNNKQ